MSEAQIIGIIIAAIVGLILALIGFFTTNNKKQKTGKHQHDCSTKGEIQQIKEELKKLQAEIDYVNSHKPRNKPPLPDISSGYGCKKNRRYSPIPLPWYNDTASTITSGYDYKTTLEELDITDFDLINEWDRRNTSYEACEEAIQIQQTLNIIDKTLESDDKQKIQEALNDLNELCFKNPEDCELLYRIGRAHVKLGGDESEELVKEHTEKGIGALETALKLDTRHAEANKWYAIALGLRCQYASMSQKMHDGLLIRKHCELACALKPDDAVLYYILGRFDYEIASLSWFERTFARAVLGNYVDATFEDALKNFQNAERYSQKQHFSNKEKKENKAMIAKTLIKLDRNIEAGRWLREAKRLGDVDFLLDKEVNTLLQKY